MTQVHEVIFSLHSPMRRECVFGASPDRPAHSGETGAAGSVNYKQAVVDNHVHIGVPPSQAALGVSQAAAERTEGQADAAGCGAECIRMCAAIEGRKRSGNAKQVLVPSRLARLASTSTPKTQ